MAQTKTSLSTNEIKKLVEAKQILENAKTAYELVKDSYCPESLPAGKYFAEGVGIVTKAIAVKPIVDYKKLLEDHPEIDVAQYTKHTEIASITVKSLLTDNTTSLFGRILKH